MAHLRIFSALTAISLLSALFTVPPANAVTAGEATTLLNNCIAAINDPLYTRATLPGIMSYNGINYANAAAIEAALVGNTLTIHVAAGSGAFGTANGAASDLYCGNGNNNTSPDLDAQAGKRDYFFGGAGNDTVGSMWESVFYGGPGNDTVGSASEVSYFYGGPGADLVTTLSGDSFFYQEDLDTTAPTFPSAETFSTPENSTAVGNVIASESATITIFGGEDQSKFSIVKLGDSSVALSFSVAPNFEIPTDVGANNTYIVVFRAVDGSANAGYETVTVTVTNVEESSSFSVFSVAGATTFSTPVVITATISARSKVTFRANNIRIPGCIGKSTATNAPFTVTCNWKPSRRGVVTVTAIATPMDAGLATSSGVPIRTVVANRQGLR